MIVVSNSTPLIAFAFIQRFDMLRQMFGVVQIPLGLLSVIRPDMERLQQHGFSISQAIIEAVLLQADEA